MGLAVSKLVCFTNGRQTTRPETLNLMVTFLSVGALLLEPAVVLSVATR